MDDDVDITAPLHLGSFRLDRPVARGGMGEVWRGVHTPRGLPVAVKVLRPDRAARPDAAGALRIEVEAAARLDHPRVARMLELGEVDAAAEDASRGRLLAGTPYLAMPWAPGGTVAARCGRGSWTEVRAVLLDALDALACAHAHGVLHRDVKPSNLLLDADGAALLADFGLAVLRRRGLARGGSLGYAAPEQIDGDLDDLGPWTDLYALGATALALTRGDPTWRAPLVPCPRDLDPWIARLLAEDPADRYRCAADARHLLLAIDGPPEEPREAPSDPLPDVETLPSRSELTWTARRPTAAPVSSLPVDPRPPLPESWRGWTAGRGDVPLLGAGLGLVHLREPGLVGRDAERDTLWAALRDCASSGRSRAVVLRGPAGTGKTRLAGWLTATAHALAGVSSRQVSHAPEPSGDHGLTALFTAELGDPGQAPAPERHARLWRHLRDLAADRPVIVWLDDAQWGLEALQWADRALRGPSQAPVLLLLTVRDEALPARPLEAARLAALSELPVAATLRVDPLGDGDGRRLVQSLLGLAPPLAARVTERTRGNPLFAVQLVGDWVRRDLLVAAADGFRLRDDAGEALPADLSEAWTRRVEHALTDAPPAWRASLEIAAFLGHEVDEAAWARACRAAEVPRAGALVDRLVAHHLGRRAPDRPGWRFVHGMLREAIVERARVDGRATDWHRACAAALEGRAAAERRGWHHLQAGDLEDAVVDLLIGARARIDAGQPDHAEAIVERVERAGAGSEAAHLAVLRGQIAQRRGDLAGMARHAEDAATHADRSGARDLACIARLMRSMAARVRGRPDDADRALTEAEALTPDLADPKLVARVRKERASWLHALGRHDEAAALLDEALLRAPDDGALWEDLATVARARGDLQAVERALQQARESYRRRGRRWQELAVLNALGDLARHRGDPEAGALYEQARFGMEEAGSPFALVPRINLGLLRAEQGDPAATALLSDALAAATALGRRDLLAFVHLGLAACAARSADPAAAGDHLRRARAAIDAVHLVDVDVLRLAEITEGACHAAGDLEGAALAGSLARAQQAGLGPPVNRR